jgi:CBS domain-containing protein
VVSVLSWRAAERISCLVVCDGDWPVGILTERDVTAWAAEVDTAKAVADVMSKPVECVTLEATLDDVLLLSHEKPYRHMPVIDEAGALVGIVTQTNIVEGCGVVIQQLKENQG